MGVKPGQVADLLALKGDTVDNIPGAPGIGDKGARDLIVRFGSVEGALEHAAEVERKMYRESLQNYREQILLSKQLATIHCDVPVELDLEALAVRDPDPEALRELYKTLEFHSLLRELLRPRRRRGARLCAAGDQAALDASGRASGRCAGCGRVGEMMGGDRGSTFGQVRRCAQVPRARDHTRPCGHRHDI